MAFCLYKAYAYLDGGLFDESDIADVEELAAWALAQSLLLLDPSTREVIESGGPRARAD